MTKFTDRILWKVKTDFYGLPWKAWEFYVQADDIDEALKLAKEYVPAKLADPDTYAIKPENLPAWDIGSIECVWHLADPTVKDSKGDLTDQECPVCHAETGGGHGAIEYNGDGECFQGMVCAECGTTWQCAYTLSAVDSIKKGTRLTN